MEAAQVDHPQSLISVAAAFFGVGRLDFRLARRDRRRLLYASTVPAVVLLCDLILFLLQAFKSIPYDLNPSFEGRSSFWWHVYNFIGAIEYPLPALAVGLLITFSIYPVSRPQGSLAFVITAAFLAIAVGLCIFSALPTTFYDDTNRQVKLETEWYSISSRLTAQDFAFLAIGYAFLAYRGLSTPDYGRRVYGLRRRRFTGEQPSSGE